MNTDIMTATTQHPLVLLQEPNNHILEQAEQVDDDCWKNISDCNIMGMNKLNSRLQACGVKNYYFVKDDDEADQLAPSPNDPLKLIHLDKKMNHRKIVEEDLVHVKTLVWKGFYGSKTMRANIMQNKNGVSSCETKEEITAVGDDEALLTTNKGSFYFVTALRMEDKVDWKKLRQIVMREWPSSNEESGTLILELAEQSCAEHMTGFKSGSMPPGWHTVPLKLFIDDLIVVRKNDNDNKEKGYRHWEQEEEIERNQLRHASSDDGYSRCILSVGSGTPNYSLHVSLLDTIQSSLYRTNKNHQSVGPCTRTVCSFVKTNPNKTKIIPHDDATQMPRLLPKMTMMMTTLSVGNKKKGEDEQPISITRRLLHSTVKKQGKVEEVRGMLEQIGEDFPTFMNIKDDIDGDERFMSEYNKNALHYAAWKGDVETIALLIKTSKTYKEKIEDAVNIISRGMGCYGKTAIFYAITQCRDDVVLFLIAHGADLLIVNNKGQTPSSLAVNKLKESTCRVIFQTEETQLKAGRVFVNYRESHSDNKRYGDLDPRFLERDDVNFDDDIHDDIQYYRTVLSMEEGDEKIQIFQEKPYLKFGIPTLSLPRSVRVTTPIWRRENYMKLRKEKEQRMSKVHVSPDNSSVPTQSKIHSAKEKSSIITLLDGDEIDMNLLPLLKLEDLLPTSTQSKKTPYELVDSLAGIQILQRAIQESMKYASEDTAKEDLDCHVVSTAWGLDCEWRPSHLIGEQHPVATLQLSSTCHAFVIDLISLCRCDVKDLNIALTPTESMLSDTLSMLFENKATRILGFGISQDLSKLSASYPHMPCFNLFHSVIDLHSLSRRAYPRTPKSFMSSLQKAVAIHFRKKLDKTEQCSEWDVRPLRPSQLEYASLDATILPLLLSKMITNIQSLGGEGGRFLCKEHNLQMSFRFTHLEDADNNAYKVEMGSIKTSYMDRKLARQAWPTFSKNLPDVPRKISIQERQLARMIRPNKMHCNGATKKDVNKNDAPRIRKNAIELNQLTGDLSNLPSPGKMLGYTKESCIARVLRNEVMDALPENSYLRYNRRGGVIEIGNAWLLFVNFGVGRTFHKYRNEFRDGGRQVTFTVNPSRYEDSALLQNLLISDSSSIYRKHVLLFIRGSTNDKFVYCGSVTHHSHVEHEDLVNVVLQLDDFETLAPSTEDPDGIPIYSQIVTSQSSVQGNTI
jgi:hypothetical protein